MAIDADEISDGDVAPDAGSGPTLLYAIKQVELAVRAQLDAMLRPMNITASQYTALTVLRRRDGLSSAELARNSFVTAQTMGEMITSLEKRGLVIRRIDADNRRRMLISLTPEARILLRNYDTHISALEEKMVADLTQRQRNALRAYLSSCRIALGNSDAH